MSSFPGNLEDVFALFESRTNFEKISLNGQNKRKYHLARMTRLCAAFGNPQNSYKVIHVAGSKGKGSTAGYIAALLTEAGHKVGVYTSPHLVDYRERFRIHNIPFPEDSALETAYCLLKGLPAAETSLEGDGPATTFELLTLFGFMLFHNLLCDFVVLECGLGGRLDATNVVTGPKIAVITPIEMEHVEILGPTLAHIAWEKAGIFHSDTIAWTARQPPKVIYELRKAAKNNSIPLFELKFHLKRIRLLDTFRWELIWQNASRDIIEPGMGGCMQAENAALALAVVRYLKPDLQKAAISSLSSVVLPGRFQVIRRDPPIVLDGAHTPASIKATVEAFLSLKTGNSAPILLFACAKDKDFKSMARILCRHGFRQVIVSTPGTFKPGDPPAVAASFKKAGAAVELIPDPVHAWQRAQLLAGSKKGILVTGSFYMAGEIAKVL